MINLTREEAQELLNALTMFCRPNEDQVDELVYEGAIELLRARLSAPEPEPVAAEFKFQEYGWWRDEDGKLQCGTMPKREWQGLTDEDRQELAAKQYGWEGLCSAVEAKLREKNT